jgi:hypothetical protein
VRLGLHCGATPLNCEKVMVPAVDAGRNSESATPRSSTRLGPGFRTQRGKEAGVVFNAPKRRCDTGLPREVDLRLGYVRLIEAWRAAAMVLGERVLADPVRAAGRASQHRHPGVVVSRRALAGNAQAQNCARSDDGRPPSIPAARETRGTCNQPSCVRPTTGRSAARTERKRGPCQLQRRVGQRLPRAGTVLGSAVFASRSGMAVTKDVTDGRTPHPKRRNSPRRRAPRTGPQPISVCEPSDSLSTAFQHPLLQPDQTGRDCLDAGRAKTPTRPRPSQEKAGVVP